MSASRLEERQQQHSYHNHLQRSAPGRPGSSYASVPPEQFRLQGTPDARTDTLRLSNPWPSYDDFDIDDDDDDEDEDEI